MLKRKISKDLNKVRNWLRKEGLECSLHGWANEDKSRLGMIEFFEHRWCGTVFDSEFASRVRLVEAENRALTRQRKIG